jgi:hypothetical protein
MTLHQHAGPLDSAAGASLDEHVRIFSFTGSPLGLMLRGTLMYCFLFIVFRFILRRDVGSLGDQPKAVP